MSLDVTTHEHDEFCEHSPSGFTKGEFLEAVEAAAPWLIESYLMVFGLLDGLTHEEAVKMAVDEHVESAACYVGLGSCGRGWCKH